MIIRFDKNSSNHFFIYVIFGLLLCFSQPSMAQNVPSEEIQEIVIKTSLLTFNDANLSGDYSVFHALSYKTFRNKFSPDKLKEAFKSFHDKGIDIRNIITAKPVATTPTTVDSDGVMSMKGYFDIPKTKVNYDMTYIVSDGNWQVIGIELKTEKLPN